MLENQLKNFDKETKKNLLEFAKNNDKKVVKEAVKYAQLGGAY